MSSSRNILEFSQDSGSVLPGACRLLSFVFGMEYILGPIR